MDYNDFTYYRANPYARQGYIPPIAHVNRHKPQFFGQIPSGEQHLQPIGKRQYAPVLYRSNIEQQNILKSPERYPYENRIALDKSYQRNMNTIDIQGATSGSLVSPAVRNKLRARQQLIRRNSQRKQGLSLEYLQYLKNTEQEKRRQVAYEQYVRNQHINKLNSGRLPNNYYDLSYQNYNSDNKNERSEKMGNQTNDRDAHKYNTISTMPDNKRSSSKQVHNKMGYFDSVNNNNVNQTVQLGNANKFQMKIGQTKEQFRQLSTQNPQIALSHTQQLQRKPKQKQRHADEQEQRGYQQHQPYAGNHSNNINIYNNMNNGMRYQSLQRTPRTNLSNSGVRETNTTNPNIDANKNQVLKNYRDITNMLNANTHTLIGNGNVNDSGNEQLMYRRQNYGSLNNQSTFSNQIPQTTNRNGNNRHVKQDNKGYRKQNTSLPYNQNSFYRAGKNLLQ